MFPSIQHLSVRQSSTNGTGINLCQQTDRGTQAGRFVWPCAVTVRVSFLFVHKRTLAPCPILSQHFGDEDGFQSVLCISVCSVPRAGPAPFDHWAAAYPPAGFAASSAKKNSTGFRPGEAISCCLRGLYESVWVCVCACVSVCELVCGEACGLVYRCTLECVLEHLYVREVGWRIIRDFT